MSPPRRARVRTDAAARRAAGRSLLREATRVAICGVIAWAAALAPAPARADLVEEDWIEVRSEHFTILSRSTERKTRKLAADLELFRSVAIALTGSGSVASPTPTRVIVVDRATEIRELRPGTQDIGGFFLHGLREDAMVVRDFDDRTNSEILLHEFAHGLMSRSASAYPLWYSEGFAEFLSTVRRRNDRVDVGRIPVHTPDRLRSLTWLPIRRVIDADAPYEWPDDERAMFYAESWVLVHYLITSDEYASSFKDRLGRYLDALMAGTDGEEAFEAAFEVRLQVLDRDLRRYVEKGRFPGFALPAERFETGGALVAREPTRADVALVLGRVQLALGQPGEAMDDISRALAADRGNARAHAALGRATAAQGLVAEAEPHLEKAVALAPEDPRVHLDLAVYLVDRAEASDDPAARGADLARAREHFARAWKLDKSAPETYAMYGRSYLVGGDHLERAVEMLEEARRILPSNDSIRLLLAEAYLAADRPADARAAARSLLVRGHGEHESTRRARAVLEKAGSPDPPAVAGDAAPAGAEAGDADADTDIETDTDTGTTASGRGPAEPVGGGGRDAPSSTGS